MGMSFNLPDDVIKLLAEESFEGELKVDTLRRLLGIEKVQAQRSTIGEKYKLGVLNVGESVAYPHHGLKTYQAVHRAAKRHSPKLFWLDSTPTAEGILLTVTRTK